MCTRFEGCVRKNWMVTLPCFSMSLNQKLNYKQILREKACKVNQQQNKSRGEKITFLFMGHTQQLSEVPPGSELKNNSWGAQEPYGIPVQNMGRLYMQGIYPTPLGIAPSQINILKLIHLQYNFSKLNNCLHSFSKIMKLKLYKLTVKLIR